MSVVAPEKSIVPCAWAAVASVRATMDGAITRNARATDCFEKGEALRAARRFGRLTLGFLRVIGISIDWVPVVICPDSRVQKTYRPILILDYPISETDGVSRAELLLSTRLRSSWRLLRIYRLNWLFERLISDIYSQTPLGHPIRQHWNGRPLLIREGDDSGRGLQR
jgi:hypothetical protein